MTKYNACAIMYTVRNNDTYKPSSDIRRANLCKRPASKTNKLRLHRQRKAPPDTERGFYFLNLHFCLLVLGGRPLYCEI